jgi:hypothetical protein
MSSRNTNISTSVSINKRRDRTFQFPPDLPTKLRKLIDGQEVKSILVEYTQYSKRVIVVKGDDSRIPLDDYLSEKKVSKVNKDLKQRINVLRNRGKTRIDPNYIIPDFQTTEELDYWLTTINPSDRKTLEMSSANFRASKRQLPQSSTSTSI